MPVTDKSVVPRQIGLKDVHVALITSDIELLEVFYAHTISPIAIGVLTSIIMTIFIGSFNIVLGVIALLGYITIGFIIPYFSSKLGKNTGMSFDSSNRFRNVCGDGSC